jgi:hypothetical protein
MKHARCLKLPRLSQASAVAGDFASILLPLAVPLMACGHGAGDTSAGALRVPQGAHDETIHHEPCDESGHAVQPVDTNGDGKPDIRRVFDHAGGREVCRVVDLNRDGKPDLYVYFDDGGAIRRREFCYDDTGVVNAIEYYEGGKIVRREYDTGGQHRLDTWDWFDPSAAVDPATGYPAHPVRRERDTTGNGQTDQWWTWNGDQIAIAFDRTGDGKPDPETTFVLGGSGDDAGAASSGPVAATSAAATPGPDGGAAPGADGGGH